MKIYDISLALTPRLPRWPGDPDIVLTPYQSLAAGDNSNNTHLACSVHSGTHIDAPAHFIDDGAGVEQIALDVLVGQALVAEIPGVARITPEHLEALDLPAETRRLLLKTDNSAYWSNPEHEFRKDFTALTAEAAKWVVARGIQLIGVDYLSVQLFDDPSPLTHRVLLEAGAVVLEGLDLRPVSQGSYQLVCLPLKINGSDGAPARAVLIA